MASGSFFSYCTSLWCFWRQRTGLYYYQRTNAIQKNKDSTLEALYFYNNVSDQQQCIFCNSYTASKVTSVSTPFLVIGKGPFRKTFRSSRHSRAAPGGSLLRLNTARLHSMTQGHSAVFPFLKLWKRLSLPCPAAILNECKGTTWIARCFFSHCLLLLTSQTVKPRNVSNIEMKADDFRAEVKFSGTISLLDQAAFITCISTPRLAQGCTAGSELPAPLFYTFCFLTVISPDFTGHIVCLWIHSPVLTQNLLSSSSFTFQTTP